MSILIQASVIKGSAKCSREKEALFAEKRSSSFPPIFVTNFHDCTAKEGGDIRFPQPGAVVQYLGEPSNLALEEHAVCIGTPTFGGSASLYSVSESAPINSSSASAAAALSPERAIVIALQTFLSAGDQSAKANLMASGITCSAGYGFELQFPRC